MFLVHIAISSIVVPHHLITCRVNKVTITDELIPHASASSFQLSEHHEMTEAMKCYHQVSTSGSFGAAPELPVLAKKETNVVEYMCQVESGPLKGMCVRQVLVFPSSSDKFAPNVLRSAIPRKMRILVVPQVDDSEYILAKRTQGQRVKKPR